LIKVLCFFLSRKKFFFEKKNQKTFAIYALYIRNGICNAVVIIED